MNNSILKIGFVFILSFGVSLMSIAQTAGYQFDFTQTEDFTVTGTSTLHSWTVKVAKIGGEPGIINSSFKAGETIEDFYFYVDIESMDGGRGATMNNKIKTALQATDYPKIEYRQTEAAPIKAGANDKNFQVFSKGELIIGGVSKNVELLLHGVKGDDGKITLTAEKPLKFSEYNITPPSAMFGQIVCGDDIQVNVKLLLAAVAQN